MIRKDMGMYFLNEDFPLQKNSYVYSSIEDYILLRDKLNNIIENYTQNDIDKLNKESEDSLFISSKHINQPKQSKETIGDVYLLQGENNRYKIGFSKDALSRIKSLKHSSCENHILIHKIRVKNPHLKEKELHLKYKDKRLHSEWFDLNVEDVEYIKGLKNEL